LETIGNDLFANLPELFIFLFDNYYLI
jgi:hypothetical protein